MNCIDEEEGDYVEKKNFFFFHRYVAGLLIYIFPPSTQIFVNNQGFSVFSIKSYNLKLIEPFTKYSQS